MIRLIMLTVVILYSPWGQELDNAVNNMHIYDVIRILGNIDKAYYEEAAEILINGREEYALNAYMRIMETVEKDEKFYEYLVKYIDKGEMDSKLFPPAFHYYMSRSINDAVNFVLRHNNDNIDYYKWCIIFNDSNILDRLADRSYAYSDLHFNANAIMYVETGKKKYLEDMMRYGDDRIKNFYYNKIVNEISGWNIISEMIERGRGRVFINEIAENAVIHINDNYLYALNGREKALYSEMKMAIEDKIPLHFDYIGDSISIEILHSAAMLYTGDYDGYAEYRSKAQIYAPVYDYLDMLNCLFTSDVSAFNERLIYFITSNNSISLRLKAYKLLLMSRYIDDGTFFRYYITGDNEAMKPILRIAGRGTPLMYEFSQLFDHVYPYETEIDSNDLLYRIIVDYENDHINREQVMSFIERYPMHPAIPLLKDIQ